MKTKLILFCSVCKKGKQEKEGTWENFTVTVPLTKKEETFKIWMCKVCKPDIMNKREGISIGGKKINTKDIKLYEVSIVPKKED